MIIASAKERQTIAARALCQYSWRITKDDWNCHNQRWPVNLGNGLDPSRYEQLSCLEDTTPLDTEGHSTYYLHVPHLFIHRSSFIIHRFPLVLTMAGPPG